MGTVRNAHSLDIEMSWYGKRSKEWRVKHKRRMQLWHKESGAAQRARDKTSIRNSQQKGKLGHLQTAKTRLKISKHHTGMKRGPMSFRHRQKISATHKRKIASGEIVLKWHISTHKKACRCWACRRFYQLSRHEEALLRFLNDFPIVLSQHWFGKYRVDAYIPQPYHIAFEADGYEHSKTKGKEKDYRRDCDLMGGFNLPVIHIQNEELTPWLQ